MVKALDKADADAFSALYLEPFTIFTIYVQGLVIKMELNVDRFWTKLGLLEFQLAVFVLAYFITLFLLIFSIVTT